MSENMAIVRPEEPELTNFEVIERVLSSGDLSRMDTADRVAFYWRTCESLGLNPLTRPFLYLQLSGKTILYPTKDATDQLRRMHGVSVTSLRRERDDDLGLFTVFAHVRTPDGREDESSGVVNTRGLSGDALGVALMKAETKAKRRATLSIVGLGFMDESEIDGLPGAVKVDLDADAAPPAAGQPTLLEAVERQRAAMSATAAPTVELALDVMDAATSATIAPEDEEEEVDDDATAETDDIETLVAIAEADAGIEPAEAPPAPPKTSPFREAVAKAAEAPPAPAPAKGLTVTQLATLARERGAGRMAFASAMECVPADVASRIERMNDAERWTLATTMGLV